MFMKFYVWVTFLADGLEDLLWFLEEEPRLEWFERIFFSVGGMMKSSSCFLLGAFLAGELKLVSIGGKKGAPFWAV